MKDIIKFGMSGAEGLNEYFGPYLKLRGWSKGATSDMSRYNGALEKIYKRYWRHGSVNPFMELGMLIVGSAVIYHWQDKQSSTGNNDQSNGGSNTYKQQDAYTHFGNTQQQQQTTKNPYRKTMKPPTMPKASANPASATNMGGLGNLMGMMMNANSGGGSGGGGGAANMMSNLMPLLSMLK